MAVVAEGRNGRLYITPDEGQRLSALCSKPDAEYPEQALPYQQVQGYYVGIGRVAVWGIPQEVKKRGLIFSYGSRSFDTGPQRVSPVGHALRRAA